MTIFALLIISNVGLEFALLAKSIMEHFCKKKKGPKLNQVEPVPNSAVVLTPKKLDVIELKKNAMQEGEKIEGSFEKKKSVVFIKETHGPFRINSKQSG